jgi:excisionase family DNA binding protein
MPKTQPKPKVPKTAQANGSLSEVLTLSEAAAYLRLPETEVVRLIRDEELPARQVGEEWRFLLPALRAWLGTGTTHPSNKDAWMKLAGVWRNDPTLDDLVEEIYRQRRPSRSQDQS